MRLLTIILALTIGTASAQQYVKPLSDARLETDLDANGKKVTKLEALGFSDGTALTLTEPGVLTLSGSLVISGGIDAKVGALFRTLEDTSDVEIHYDTEADNPGWQVTKNGSVDQIAAGVVGYDLASGMVTLDTSARALLDDEEDFVLKWGTREYFDDDSNLVFSWNTDQTAPHGVTAAGFYGDGSQLTGKLGDTGMQSITGPNASLTLGNTTLGMTLNREGKVVLLEELSPNHTISFPRTSGTILLSNGSGAALTSLNASALTTGVVPAARGGAGAVNGLLKANGSGTVSAAVAGTDYLTPAQAITSSAISITTADFYDAWGNGGLKPGQWYCLTDFKSTYTRPTLDGSEVVEEDMYEFLYVLADVGISSPLIACLTEHWYEDIIYYDVERNRIARRIDILNNIDCVFDWRNVKFYRYKIDTSKLHQASALGGTNVQVGTLCYGPDNNGTVYTSLVEKLVSSFDPDEWAVLLTDVDNKHYLPAVDHLGGLEPLESSGQLFPVIPSGASDIMIGGKAPFGVAVPDIVIDGNSGVRRIHAPFGMDKVTIFNGSGLVEDLRVTGPVSYALINGASNLELGNLSHVILGSASKSKISGSYLGFGSVTNSSVDATVTYGKAVDASSIGGVSYAGLGVIENSTIKTMQSVSLPSGISGVELKGTGIYQSDANPIRFSLRAVVEGDDFDDNLEQSPPITLPDGSQASFTFNVTTRMENGDEGSIRVKGMLSNKGGTPAFVGHLVHEVWGDPPTLSIDTNFQPTWSQTPVSWSGTYDMNVIVDSMF